MENNRINFVLNGCDISFIAQAPADITLEKLLKQCDKIHPDYCACGICSLNCIESPCRGSENVSPEIIIDYDSIRTVDEIVSCTIREN